MYYFTVKCVLRNVCVRVYVHVHNFTDNFVSWFPNGVVQKSCIFLVVTIDQGTSYVRGKHYISLAADESNHRQGY